MSEYSFKQGDDLWNILRKLLALLNTSTIVAATSATDPSQGDTSWCFFRKILIRLGELVPEATAEYETGDSQWALVRKILQVFNEDTLVASTSATLFAQGDNLEVLSRKILDRLFALVPTASTEYRYRAGDSLNVIWRKILSVLDLDVDAPFAPSSVEAPSDLHIAILDWAGKIKVLWQDNATNETGFEVYTSTNGVAYTLATTRAANVTYAVLEDLLNQSYWVKVRAISGEVVSAFDGPEVVNPFTGGVPELAANYDVGGLIESVDITVPNVADPPGDVVVYESDNDDLTDPVVVDTITLPPNAGGRTHTISNHGVAVTRRNVFARQRNALLAESGASDPVTAADPTMTTDVATDWADRVEANGGVRPSQLSIDAAASFATDLVLAGIASKMYSVSFVAPDNKIAARTPFYHSLGTDPWTFDQPAYTDAYWRLSEWGMCPANGLGDSTGWWPGINPSVSLNKNDFGMTVFGDTCPAMNSWLVLASSGSDYLLMTMNYGNTSSASAINGFADSSYVGVTWTPKIGYYSANRTSNTVHKMYFANDTTAHYEIGSATGANTRNMPNASIKLIDPTGGGSWADNVIGFFGFHSGLTQAESAALYSAVAKIRADFLVSDWRARVITAGGAAPSANTLSAAKTFLRSLLSAGILSKMLDVNIFAPDSLTACLVPLVKRYGSSTWGNVGPFVSGDLTVNGLESNGSTKWLNTGFVPSTAYAGSNQYDAGLTAYLYSGDLMIGDQAGPGAAWWHSENGSCCWHQNELNLHWTGTPGYYSVNRTASNSMKQYYAKSSSAHAQVGTTVTTDNGDPLPYAVYVGASNDSNLAVQNKVTGRYSFVAFHKGLDATQSSAFYNAIQALRVALGGGYA